MATDTEILLKENQELTSQNNDLFQKNSGLQTELELAQAKSLHYETEYNRLIQAFKQAQREKYGRKSEAFLEDEGIRQQPLFGSESEKQFGQEADEARQEDQETKKEDIEYITYTRHKKGKKKNDTSCIPTREVIIPVEEAEKKCECGNQKEVIRYAQKTRLNYQPAVFEIVIEKREVVACRKGCTGSIKTASAPETILPKCRATESLLAQIAISKVLDRQPLYHLEKQFETRYHWNIPRQTMARWLIQLADKLQPLINLMKDELVDYDIAYTDATTLQVLNEPGRPPDRKSYAYCIRGGPPGKEVTIFEYNAYSQKEYVKETFLGFKGIIHTDADRVYDDINQEKDIFLSYCHAHARRKFEQIYKATGKKGGLAKQMLKYYQELYKIERFAKENKLTPQEIYELRQEKSKPIMAEMKAWLDHYSQRVLPKSPIGKAIAYCLNHWEGLTTFLQDGRIEIDNNTTEREIKPFVIARKNFLFACTEAGADALGVHFSLILTARNHGLSTFHYYKTILEKIPYCNSFDDYQKLLPWNIKLSA